MMWVWAGVAWLVGIAAGSFWHGLTLAAFVLVFSLGRRVGELSAELSALREQIGLLRGRLAPEPPAPAPVAPSVEPRAAYVAEAPEQAREPGDVAPVVTAEPPPSSPGETSIEPAPPLPSRASTEPDPRPAPPSPSEAPAQPGPSPSGPRGDERSFEQCLRDLVLGDNPMARVGIVVLLVGVALLLRLAAEHAVFPIEARLAAVALGGGLLTAFGYRQREKRRTFSRLLQGGGVAIMYLVVFFSYRVFEVLPAGLTFGLLITVALSSGVLAVAQNALSLIIVGTVGGFAAPIVASSGSGDHVALFSYYIALNLLVLGVAWFKEWRPLTLIGFVGTFGVGTFWGVLRYEPDHFASTEPFLVAFFAIYFAITAMTVLRRRAPSRFGINGTLVFGLPLVTMALQTALAGDRDWIVAVSALALAALYYVFARLLARRDPALYGTLTDAFAALSVGFATLAVPYAIESDAMVASTWMLEAAGLYWVGTRTPHLRGRVAGVGLLLAGLVAAVSDDVWTTLPEGSLPLFNASSLCALIFAGATLFMSSIAVRHRESLTPSEPAATQALIPLAALVLAVALGLETEAHAPAAVEVGLWLASFSVALFFFAWLGSRMDVAGARLTALAIVPIASLGLLLARTSGDALWEDWGALTWTVTAAMFFGAVRIQGARDSALLRYGHAALPLFFAALAVSLVHDLAREVMGLRGGWMRAIDLAALSALVTVMARVRDRLRDPYLAFAGAHRFANRALALVTVPFWFACAASPANAEPLPFVPILNPVHLAMIFHFLVLVTYARREASERESASGAPAWAVPLGLLAFATVNVFFAHGVHHVAGVPYDRESLWRADAFQVGLSILWACLGLAGTFWASRRRRREVWIVAAALLGVVVLKIFSVDLAQVGQAARILSFLAVGGLLLAVGYAAPVPPAEADGPVGDEEMKA
jgi:uncharacterized membrane protein